MILDELNEFADATSVAAAAGTAIIGDVMDLGLLPNNAFNGSVPTLVDFGGESIFIVIEVSTQIITAGSAGTVAFQLVTAPTATITTNGIVVVQGPTLITDDAAALNALIDTDITNGTPDVTHLANQTPLLTTSASWHPRLARYMPVLMAMVPPRPLHRYLGITATTATTTTTAGAINAYLTKDPHRWRARPTYFTDKGSP